MSFNHLVLVGGGHSNALLMRLWLMKPALIPSCPISIISRDFNLVYSAMFPGVIAGEFTEKTMAKSVKSTALRLMLFKRFARYNEMVGAAIFLASDDANYLTAQTISVNGGAHVRMR